MDYLLGDTDEQTFAVRNLSMTDKKESLDKSEIPTTSERAIIEKDRKLVYEDSGKRFEFPTTPEGYAMFQRLLDRTFPETKGRPQKF